MEKDRTVKQTYLLALLLPLLNYSPVNLSRSINLMNVVALRRRCDTIL